MVVEATSEQAGGSVRADPSLLWIVLDKVISNAIQAMPEGGTTRVILAPSSVGGDNAVCIEVQDSGHGMDDKVISRAMDPFFTTRPSGTGLGLSIVQRIMEAHGGSVQLRSRPGEGTTVTLLIPTGSPSSPMNLSSRDEPTA